MNLRIEFVTPGFWQIPPKKITTTPADTGRVYFLHKDRIVAVAIEVR